MNISQWLKHATLNLAEYESASLDAQILLCHVLECDRTKIYSWPNEAITDAHLNELNALLERRKQGEPVAYLVGQREFWSLELEVSQSVLVPRPDTELIVELALQALSNSPSGPVLDAGTGSGAIAIALSHELRERQTTLPSTVALNVIASDASTDALTLAKRNAIKHDLHNIEFVRAHWLEAFADNTFGMIISNPPYLANGDPHLQNKTLQFEPSNALVSGPDGLEDIRQLIADARRAGKAECPLLLEHGSTQGASVRELLLENGYAEVTTHQDMPGLDRVTSGIVRKN